MQNDQGRIQPPHDRGPMHHLWMRGVTVALWALPQSKRCHRASFGRGRPTTLPSLHPQDPRRCLEGRADCDSPCGYRRLHVATARRSPLVSPWAAHYLWSDLELDGTDYNISCLDAKLESAPLAAVGSWARQILYSALSRVRFLSR